jgi:sulfoacetaldehyde acetyltransferase
MTASRAVVEVLRAEEVKHIFYLPGSGILPILDALYDAKEIQTINARHEQSAAHMADGYARVTGKPGVCIVPNGPGVTNSISGIATAQASYSPVVLISAAPVTSQIDKEAIQEIDQEAVLKPLVKWNTHVTRAGRVSELLRHAFRVALSGRKGPVHVDIPRDLLYEVVEINVIHWKDYRTVGKIRGDLNLMKQAAERLAASEKPLMIVGGGVIWDEATSQVLELAELLTMPIATSYGHMDAVPSDHPLAAGQLGRDGSEVARLLAQNSDLILALGTELGHLTTFYGHKYIPKGVPIIQVNIDPREIGRNYPVEIGIVGDIKETVKELTSDVRSLLGESAPKNKPRIENIANIKEEQKAEISDKIHSEAMPIKPQRVFKELRDYADRDAVIVLDEGGTCTFGNNLLEFYQPRTFLSPLKFACLGWAFPAALGAKVAFPQRQVFAVCGDGGFAMSMLELGTAVQYDIPVVVLVLNNHSFGSEKISQRYFFESRYIGTDLLNPDFTKVAEAYGAFGVKVEKPSELRNALQDALAAGTVAVIDVNVDPEELSRPARRDEMIPRLRG